MEPSRGIFYWGVNKNETFINDPSPKNYQMVVISERSVEQMIEEVAPRVTYLTGWDPHLDTLNVKLIERKQHWEYVTKAMYEALGIDAEPKTEKGKSALSATRFLTPLLLIAQYEPVTGTMIVIPDNIRLGTNESGLVKTLGHELVHRCQFINNPHFASMYGDFIKRKEGTIAFDIDGHEEKGVMKYLESYMTLVEGDASFVEEQLKKMFYQDAQNKTSWLCNFLGIGLLVTGGLNGKNPLMRKAKQYVDGKKKVKREYLKGGRESVNGLYEMDEEELYRIF